MNLLKKARPDALALLLAIVILVTLLPLSACSSRPSAGAPALVPDDAPAQLPVDTVSHLPPDLRTIVLDSRETADGWVHTATADGGAVTEYDYAWHCDPSAAHSEVKDAPAEYYTGTAPGEEAVYIAHDVAYYPSLPVDSFVKKNYDGEEEWCCYYTDGEHNDYIFATLPVQGNAVPEQMMHTPQEAYDNAVLHITQPGTYAIEGLWHGQINIDLGEETFTDESAKVTVILNGVDVTCTVAPALIFQNVYECDNTWEDRESYSADVDTAGAGANVIIADGTENNFSGANVFRMLKTAYKKNQEGKAVPVQKKMRKTDAAFYSYMSMNIDGQSQGTGVLNVTSAFEGLDSELHLTFNGGNVNIFAQDDGVNVNEDGVSVVAFNGGSVHILAGLGSEGDGVDSNGFLAVNGGTVISMANPRSDAGLDSDCGSFVNGGTVVALGSTMDWAEADEERAGQVTMNLRFSSPQSSDEALIVTDLNGKVIFAYDPDKDEVAGTRIRSYQGAILSSPAFVQGETYHIYVGGDVTGPDTAGVYDPAAVTGFTDAAKLQSYAGTWENTGRPDFGNRGEFDPDHLPEGFDPDRFQGQRPDRQPGDRNDRQPPAGDGQPPRMPDDGQRPDGFDPDQFFDKGGREFGGRFGQEGADAPRTIDFTMTALVNNFNQVSDAEPS